MHIKNDKKKITLFIHSLGGGGAEKVAVTIANGLQRRGYAVDFVVLNLDKQINRKYLDAGITFYNLNKKHARVAFGAIFQYLKKYKPEKILVFNHELAVVLQMIRMLSGIHFKIIARNISSLTQKKKYEQSFWHRYIKDFFIRLLYNRVDNIIAQTDLMKEDLVNNYQVDDKKIVVINNPLDSRYEEVCLDNKSHTEKNSEILFVGRLEEVKGLFYLLKAFKVVLSKDQDVILRIVGEGSLKGKLINYAEEQHILNNIIFENYQSNLIPFYEKTAVTVLSSLYEGFPNVLIESIACGTPVVSFDCNSGPSEIIIDGENGYLVRYKDSRHLAECIITALNKKWDNKRIKKTAERFCAEKILNDYVRVLSESNI